MIQKIFPSTFPQLIASPIFLSLSLRVELLLAFAWQLDGVILRVTQNDSLICLTLTHILFFSLYGSFSAPLTWIKDWIHSVFFLFLAVRRWMRKARDRRKRRSHVKFMVRLWLHERAAAFLCAHSDFLAGLLLQMIHGILGLSLGTYPRIHSTGKRERDLLFGVIEIFILRLWPGSFRTEQWPTLAIQFNLKLWNQWNTFFHLVAASFCEASAF